MTHIDLYRAFDLDRSASPNELVSRLEGQLAAADPANIALREQIQTASAILGDPGRRAAYDARLADPTSPTLDPAALQQLAGAPAPGGDSPAAGYGVPATGGKAALSLPSTKVLLAIVAVLAVAVIAAVTALVVGRGGDSGQSATPATSVEQGQPAPQASDARPPSQSAAPAAPVVGAYPGAGGPRPASAEPLPTYTGRYSNLLSAHLLTPTGGIGCDFNAPDPARNGNQGACGVRSMNRADSPLGTEKLAGSTKGKWLFQFADNRVGDPVATSGTTGWMNQPAGDGYQVPRVQYGKQYYFQDWAIASELNGLTVWNTETGSGVFLSNEKAEKFDGPGGDGGAPPNNGDPEIVLGSSTSNSKGFGNARPAVIHSGGSGSSTYAYDLSWQDWGGERATGIGLGYYAQPGSGRANAPVEEGVPVTVVAFEPTMCQGQRAYTKVAYYFPSKGETFESARILSACWDR